MHHGREAYEIKNQGIVIWIHNSSEEPREAHQP